MKPYKLFNKQATKKAIIIYLIIEIVLAVLVFWGVGLPFRP